MPKSMSLGKQNWIYIVVLFVGVAIGALLPVSRAKFPAALNMTSTTPASTDCASVATEPSNEILGAPRFREAGTIQSSVDGLILVRWNDVKGAKAYNVRVWNEEGQEIKNFQAPRTFTFLKNLAVDPKQKETPYFVVVTPLGDENIRGKDSEKKMVAMLPLRNLEPPTIKSIQTEAEEQPK